MTVKEAQDAVDAEIWRQMEAKRKEDRKLIAMHAMEAILSNSSMIDQWHDSGLKVVAKRAVFMADALLSELEN